MKRIAAMVMNDKGELLPYICDSTKEQCEERAAEFFFPAWDQLKELGAKVVQVEISVIEEAKSDVPLTAQDYEYCPHCRGSFSFSKPIKGLCPWCSKNIPPIEGEPGFDKFV